MTEIALAAGIAELRRQITQAMARAEGEPLQFTLGPIELELQVQMSREASGKGEIRVWVVSLEAAGKLASNETHKVRLTLMPRQPSGADVRVGHRKRTTPAE
jgi:hypothetical protein